MKRIEIAFPGRKWHVLEGEIKESSCVNSRNVDCRWQWAYYFSCRISFIAGIYLR